MVSPKRRSRWRHGSVCLAAAAVSGVATAQEAASQPAAGRPACSVAEHRQFDFWLGDWEVFAPDGKKAGENRIESIDGGCALIERWRGRGGFSGTSLNSWDAAGRRWRQHWVDNQGGVLRLEGRFESGRMVLEGREPDPAQRGTLVRQRITWTPLASGEVRQLWEQSRDDGVTWTVAFDGRYVRIRSP
jgi:hypothetical protein